jgi:hypothetical protein
MCDFVKAYSLSGINRFSVLLIFILFSFSLFAQPSNEKYKDVCKDMVIHNGHIYLSGITKSLGNGNRCGYIAKYNTDGAFLKEFFWGRVETDEFHEICFSDDAIFTTGISYWRGGNSNEIVTAKLNTDLELQWIKNFGGLHWQYGFALRAMADESLVFGGMDRVCGLGSPIVVKMSSSGETIWQNNYGDCGSEYLVDVDETSNGNIKLLCSLGGFYNYGTLWSSSTIKDADIIVYDVNTNGEVLSIDTLGGTQHDIPVKILTHPVSGNLLLAHSQSYNTASSFDIVLYFLNEDNSISDLKVFGGDEFEYASDVKIDINGDIHIVGTSASFSDYPVIYYLKLSASGHLLEEKVVLPEYHAYGATLALNDTSVYIAANVISEEDYGEIILLKDFNLCDTFVINDSIPEIELYPNPSNGVFYINDYGFFKASNNAVITIFDMSGRAIWSGVYNGGRVRIDISGLCSGNVLLLVQNEKYSVVKKLIIK